MQPSEVGLLGLGLTGEVRLEAIYPNRRALPRDTWLSLLGSAVHEIDILARSGLFLAKEPGVLDALAGRARDGVRVRICLRDPDRPVTAEPGVGEGADDAGAAGIRQALALFGQLRTSACVKIRLHRAVLYNSIYRSDDQVLISQHAYGVADERAPVLYLRSAADGDLFTTYLDAFDRIWAGALAQE